MAEPTSSLTYVGMQTEVIRRVSCTTADALMAVDMGYLWYQNAHDWSFNRVSTTCALYSGTGTTTLPDDYGGMVTRFSYASGAGYYILAEVSSEEILDRLSSVGNVGGPPRVFAIEATPLTAATGQRWQVRWYPIPDASYTLTYRYRQVFPALSGTATQYFAGGNQYSQLILYSALSQHEETKGDVLGTYHRTRDQELARCIERDQSRHHGGIIGVMGPGAEYRTWEIITDDVTEAP